jgi:hypothetical protein
MIKQLIARLALIAILAVPALAFAQGTTPNPTTTVKKEPLFSSINQVVAKACDVVNVVFTGAIIITIVFVLLAAIKYITNGADPGKISEAHKQLMWAAIGFAVALVARTMPFIVATVLGDPSLADPC